MTGTMHLVPPCPGAVGQGGFVPVCPGFRQGNENAGKYANQSLVPVGRGKGRTAYGGPNRRRERGSPRRGDPFPLGTRPDPAGLSRSRINHPGSRGDLASVHGLRKRQRFGARAAVPFKGLCNLESRWRVLPGTGLHGGNSHPDASKSLKNLSLVGFGCCCCPQGDRQGDRLVRIESEDHHDR